MIVVFCGPALLMGQRFEQLQMLAVKSGVRLSLSSGQGAFDKVCLHLTIMGDSDRAEAFQVTALSIADVFDRCLICK
jgi:hypothetical protein